MMTLALIYAKIVVVIGLGIKVVNVDNNRISSFCVDIVHINEK